MPAPARPVSGWQPEAVVWAGPRRMVPALAWLDESLLELAERADLPGGAAEALTRAIDENRESIGESLREIARREREE